MGAARPGGRQLPRRRPVGRRRRLHHRRPYGPRRQRRLRHRRMAHRRAAAHRVARGRVAARRALRRGAGGAVRPRLRRDAARLRRGHARAAETRGVPGRSRGPRQRASDRRRGVAARRRRLMGGVPGRRVRAAGVQQDPRPGRGPRRHGEDRVPRPALHCPLRPRRGLLLELQQLRPRRHGEDQAASRGRLAPRGRPPGRPSARLRADAGSPLAPPRPDRAPPRRLGPSILAGNRAPPQGPRKSSARQGRSHGARKLGPSGFRFPPCGTARTPAGIGPRGGAEGPSRNDQGGQRWRI